MSEGAEDRISKLVQAYFSLPRTRYAEVVSEVRMSGGLTPAEVRTLMDRLPFIHSDTIIRQTGLCEQKRC
jgi:hypothetical protein